jgi:hypothetical protein
MTVTLASWFRVVYAAGLFCGACGLCRTVYVTDGEVVQGLAYLVCAAFAMAYAFAHVARIRGALLIATALYLGLLGRQVGLQRRLFGLEAEVRAVAAYVERVRGRSGRYPPDLRGYAFQRDWRREHLRYWPPRDRDDDWYAISYELVVGETVKREYGPEKGWHYYPD